MKCEQIQTFLLSYLENDISDDIRQQVDRHLEMCGICRNELAQLRSSWQMMDSYNVPELSDDFTDKLMARIQKEQDKPQTILKTKRSNWQIGIQYAAAAILFMTVTLSFTFIRIHFSRQQNQVAKGNSTSLIDNTQKSIPTDEEVIKNLDLLVNLELLENLEVLEQMDTQESTKAESKDDIAWNEQKDSQRKNPSCV